MNVFGAERGGGIVKLSLRGYLTKKVSRMKECARKGSQGAADPLFLRMTRRGTQIVNNHTGATNSGGDMEREHMLRAIFLEMSLECMDDTFRWTGV